MFKVTYIAVMYKDTADPIPETLVFAAVYDSKRFDVLQEAVAFANEHIIPGVFEPTIIKE